MRACRRTEPQHPKLEGRLQGGVPLPPRRNGVMTGERQRRKAVDDAPRLELRAFPPAGRHQTVGHERVECTAEQFPRRRGRQTGRAGGQAGDAAPAEHEAKEFRMRHRELDVRPPDGLEPRDRRPLVSPALGRAIHRFQHPACQLLESARRGSGEERRLVVKMSVRRIRGHAHVAGCFPEAEGGLPALLDQSHRGCNQRVAEIAVVIRLACLAHKPMLTPSTSVVKVYGVHIVPGDGKELPVTAIHRVLVCGATGRQGGAVSRALSAHGFEVLALTRSPQAAAAKELERLGAQVVGGDLSQVASLHPIMKDVDAVFSVQNYWERGVGAEGELRQAENLFAAAEENGVRHVVQSIMARARTYDGIAHFESKQRIADRLRLGPLPFTTLGTVWFMDNILDPKMGGSQTLPILAGSLASRVSFPMVATAGDSEGACRWAQVHAWKNPGLRLEPRRRIPFGKTKDAQDCRGRDPGRSG